MNLYAVELWSYTGIHAETDSAETVSVDVMRLSVLGRATVLTSAA